ncbi:MAG: DUF1007 family protein [Methylobacteriaceae bacterium]|nr:DUF1007 family protein [Methylobacteriaceae bacterium]
MVGAALAATLLAGPGLAHPHVWVVVKSQIVFDASGKIAAIRHAWTFDEMYSAFQTQGLAKDGKKATRADMADLAKLQAEQLAEFDFFTVAKAAGRKQGYGTPTEVSLEEGDDKLVTLRFTLPLKETASAGRAFALQVYDPSYFVSFEYDKTGAVTLDGAPAGCTVNIVQPPPLIAEDAKKKDESFFSGLSPGAEFGVKLASRAVVACP